MTREIWWRGSAVWCSFPPPGFTFGRNRQLTWGITNNICSLRDLYQERLAAAGFGRITTDIALAGPFFFAEGYHQQYLDKNPNGYCPDHGTGGACPLPSGVAFAE